MQLGGFRWVRWFLTHDASLLVVNAFVSSLLDYCSSLLMSISKFNLYKLQCIQNSVARIVSNTSRYGSITTIHKQLYWLHAEYHYSVIKIATQFYRFIDTGFQKYLEIFFAFVFKIWEYFYLRKMMENKILISLNRQK